uniref:BED-type domain-containing protein n=1 Tax=Heterorhabditis bacteriophora TaxID=37862 RepID=A0A1I7XK32_HETBA
MSFVQDTTYIPTSYSYGDQHKDFYEPPLAVLPYGFQQPQHGTIGQQLQVHGSQLKSLDHYQQPLPIQSSGFYYTAAAGPSVISHNDALNGTNVEPEHTVQSLDHYQQPHSIQSSGFYYTTTAGPSVISHGDTPHAPTVVPEQAVHSEEDASTSSGPSGKKRGTKRGRPTKNPVWTFFHRVDDKSVQCNMCARQQPLCRVISYSCTITTHNGTFLTLATSISYSAEDFSGEELK